MNPLAKRFARRTGWIILQTFLIAVILGLIAAMWTPLIRQWMK